MKNNLWNILKKELMDMFRDKKSLMMMLLIPALIPLIMLGMSAFFESEMSKDIEEYNKIGITYEMTEEEKAIAKEMNIELISGTKEELEQKYKDEKISLYVSKNDNIYTINNDGSTISTHANELMKAYFDVYKAYLQQNYLKESNIDVNELLSIITVEENVLEQDNFAAGYIKNYSFLFIIMAITVSATYPATDTTAGEKERGTLETLLTFPINSKDIILGKFFGVTISSIITGVISLILAILSLVIAQDMFTIYEGANILFNSASVFFSVIIIIVYSIFISGLCISIASKSKSFKEAQSALTPLTFISFFPSMIVFMMGISATNLLSIIPFLNYTVVFMEINNGIINYSNILLMLISTIVYISIILTYIIRQYKSEKVLFSK